MARYYHQKELRHNGLNKYRVVKAATRYELEEKCDAIIRQWDAQWSKKCEVEQRKSDKAMQVMQAEECLAEANRLTVEAEEKQVEIVSILVENLKKDVDKSINPFLRKDKFSVSKPKLNGIIDVPIEPKREDEKYNPKVGLISKLFGGEQRSKIENDDKFNKDYESWNNLKDEIIFKNEKTNEMHQKELQNWNNSKEMFEIEKNKTNEEVAEFWENLKNGDAECVSRYCANILDRLSVPVEYDMDFDFDYISDSKMAVVDFCLPTIEDLPTLKKVTFVKSQKIFKETYQTDSYMKKIYDQVIYQIVLSILNILFNADSDLNHLESVVVNGKVNTIDKSTGQDISPYILSVSIKKENFSNLNLNSIDAKEWFKANKGVSAVTFSSVTPVMPIIQMSKDDNRFIEGYDVTGSIDETTNLASMDWQDFENLIRELFEKEFNQNGGEVKITQASRDGGVDAVAFDPDPIRGGKIVIQAKRYTNVVGVSAIRDLYGTVMNEGATKGILVSTANYGSDAYEFAKNKPLTLLSGANLLSLLEKHGHKAKIDIKEAKEYLASIK